MVGLRRLFLITSTFIIATSVLAVDDNNNDAEVSEFFETYQGQELFFEPLKAKEFEYICEEPVNDIDCRKHNIDYLDSPISSTFSISNILYKDQVPFFELTFQEKKYYILSKRLINGLNVTNFYTDALTSVDQDLSNDDGMINVRHFLSGTFKLCNGKIKKYSCDTNFTEISDFNVLVVKIIKVNNRNIIKVIIEEDGREFWIEEYFLKKLGKQVK